MQRTIPVALVVGLVMIVGANAAAAAGTWTWPVRGPIVRPYEPPALPYGAGHRGIDLAAPGGTVILAPAPGVVSFAGRVAGQLFVSIDHGAGLVSTSSYLSAALVAKGDAVVAGQPIALSGSGHPGSVTEHVHFGVRLGGVYVDPLDYLVPISLVGILWLAPIDGSAPLPGPQAGPRALPAGGSRLGLAPWGPATTPPILTPGARPSSLRGRPVPA